MASNDLLVSETRTFSCPEVIPPQVLQVCFDHIPTVLTVTHVSYCPPFPNCNTFDPAEGFFRLLLFD